MTTHGDSRPVGFCGPVACWQDLLPPAERVLRLPHDRARVGLAPRSRGEVVEPSLRFQLIEVQSFTESLGRIEDALPTLAERLTDDGVLVVEVDNLQSPRQLRLVLEGRPGAFDVAGSLEDPALPLPLRRVLSAITASDLQVVDVVRVPADNDAACRGLGQSGFAHGMLPLEWLAATPPSRFWLRCERRRTLAGSVLIGVGEAAAQQATANAIRSFLPADWEIVVAESTGEATGWNRAVVRARGELVWFLRAGALPGKALFSALHGLAMVGPAAPGNDGDRAQPGDLSGLMLARDTVLLAGPIDETYANSRIGLEAWHMRLDSCAAAVVVAEGEFTTPPAPVEVPAQFARESEQLLAAWSPIHGERPAAPAIAERPAVPAPWQGRSPKVSLCMIARNEERFLADCLQQARAAVDEIVLVDTGSTDRTIAIAESFGAKVVQRPWDDDFSAPRNEALRHATGDWILVLDADEFLVGDACARIRELVTDASVSGYHLHFTNLYTGGKTLGVMMVRLFRNLPGIEYQNVIHEQVTPSLTRIGGELGLILSQCDVEVEHHGYTDELMASRAKNERNERLFQKQLARHPDDIYSLYKYGDFLRRVPGRGDDARDLLERCLQQLLAGPPSMPRQLPFAGEVAALCALEFARAGRTQRALEIVDTALRRFLPTPNLHYLAASLLLGNGKHDDAIAHFRRCLAYRGQVLVVPIQDGITGHVSLAGIAQAWLQKGDFERARRLLEQAIALEPRYEVSHLVLSRLHLLRGDTLAALHTLTAYLAAHPESPGACQQTTLILQSLGMKDQARRMGARALGLLEARALDHEASEMKRILAAI
ncbi:MAG: glycosyltransferase [Planctomycetes bacterium]|nr:glycosyltransferase [Planctomycetota bacterium]